MRWTRRLRLCVAGAVTASALFAVPVAQAAQPSDARLDELVESVERGTARVLDPAANGVLSRCCRGGGRAHRPW